MPLFPTNLSLMARKIFPFIDPISIKTVKHVSAFLCKEQLGNIPYPTHCVKGRFAVE